MLNSTFALGMSAFKLKMAKIIGVAPRRPTHETNILSRFGIRLKGRRHKYHKKADNQARNNYWNQFVRFYEQSQNQEHNQLEQPRETVKEFDCGFFMYDFVVSHNQSANIDGQVAIAVQEIRRRENEDAT